MKHLLIVLSILCFFAGCNTKRIENTKELSREIKSTQIKRVTNTQLIYTIDEWGKKIEEIAQKALEKELKNKPGNTESICKDLSKIPVLAALEKEYGVEIELLNDSDLNNKQLLPKEIEILKAYQYSANSNPTSQNNIQKLNDSLYVYNAPIAAENIICLSCATKESPFLLWRLLFDKKVIIRKLDAKKLGK